MNELGNLRGFNLFIDLDDVLISSHNEMNDDLKSRYPKLDWAIGADLLTIVNENSKALKEMPDERAKRAYDAYIELRADVQRDGMRYDEMERRFEMMHQYQFDCTHTTEENDVFHYIIKRLEKSFIERERFLDLRDTRLYLDNKEDVDKAAVHYENYYTRERLMSSERDRKIPEEVAKLAKEQIFTQPLKVLSHMNGKNEVAAKTAFLKENYPDTLFTPLFFHENNNFDPEFRRPRYSKAKYVMNELGMDITSSILIDDSIENITNWVMNGGIGIIYDVKNRFVDTEDYYVIHEFTHEAIMGVMRRISEDKKGKKLIKTNN